VVEQEFQPRQDQIAHRVPNPTPFAASHPGSGTLRNGRDSTVRAVGRSAGAPGGGAVGSASFCGAAPHFAALGKPDTRRSTASDRPRPEPWPRPPATTGQRGAFPGSRRAPTGKRCGKYGL